MSIGDELKRALTKVSERAKNERISSEKNYRLVSRGEQLPSEIYQEIIEMTKKAQNVQDECVEIERENVRYQRKIKILDEEIQKQTAYTEMLKRHKDDIVKNGKSLSIKEREDELNVHLDEKKRLMTTIEEEINKIQQLFAENEDKFEFIYQQVNTITKRNQEYKKNKQLIKRNKYEKEDEHYQGLCKGILIRGVLASQINFKTITKLKEEKESLEKQFQRSVKDLNMALYKADHCKSDIVLQFDSHYDRENKDELLKLITSIFNMLITIGFTNYWREKAEMTKRKIELWSTKDQSGKPVKFHSPFSRIVVMFPNTFDYCYEFKGSKDNSTTTMIRTNYNIPEKNDGFESLQLE